MARTRAYSCVQGDVLIKIRKSENGDDAGRTEPKGPGCHGRSHAVWQGHTGDRQNLQLKRTSTGYPISGTRPRSRKSSCKGGLASEKSKEQPEGRLSPLVIDACRWSRAALGP